MKINSINQVNRDPLGPPMHKGKVETQVLVPESNDVIVDILHFSKGARNRLHTHPVDQILVVVGGEGIVATDKEEKRVKVGDVILFPAGEKHWHGAAENSEFSHLFVLKKDFAGGHRATIVEEMPSGERG